MYLYFVIFILLFILHLKTNILSKLFYFTSGASILISKYTPQFKSSLSYFSTNSYYNNQNGGYIKKHKRNVNGMTKKQVASNQKWTCNHCKQLLDATYEIDHIHPLFKGGDNSIINLQALCRNCHAKKTMKDLE
jgi:hypothetical protein